MWTPICWAAERTVVPAGTETAFPSILRVIVFMSLLLDRLELARPVARAALHALRRVDNVHLLGRTRDRSGRAGALAQSAGLALVGDDGEGDKRGADTGRALLFADVREVLVAIVVETRDEGVRRGPAEAAERGG